ncbi:DUF4326 domain-containing protein [Streptomyces sp. NPDC051597]|uniref:DUF4326 domain-containing protein n=1 Tax=Streptomyces sp. NPDC051597 TaxID=3155049 RepID=UPI00343E7DF6
MPARIQRKRTAGWRRGDAIIVDRSSRYGNPFRIVGQRSVEHPDRSVTWSCETPELARAKATELYEAWLNGVGAPEYSLHGREFDRGRVLKALRRGDLAGRDLACTCPLPQPSQPDHCHAAILLWKANQPEWSPR